MDKHTKKTKKNIVVVVVVVHGINKKLPVLFHVFPLPKRKVKYSNTAWLDNILYHDLCSCSSNDAIFLLCSDLYSSKTTDYANCFKSPLPIYPKWRTLIFVRAPFYLFSFCIQNK